MKTQTPVSPSNPLVVGRYYYLNPQDAPRYNVTRQPRVMYKDTEIGCWTKYLPILIPMDRINDSVKATLDFYDTIGKPIDKTELMLECVRSLCGVLRDDGVLVMYSTPPLNSGIVPVTITTLKRTEYHSMFTDLFLHPDLVKAGDESGDPIKSNGSLRVILRLVDRGGRWIAKV